MDKVASGSIAAGFGLAGHSTFKDWSQSMMHLNLKKTIAATALALALIPVAQADGDPFWSLVIGVPGLVANVGNAYPMAPQPVYVAPPVQYAPVPGYDVAQPYAPARPYPYEHRRWRGDHHDEGDHGDHGDGGDR
jgi:hypothetical protein